MRRRSRRKIHLSLVEFPITGKTLIASFEGKVVRIAFGRYSSKKVIKGLQESLGPCECAPGTSANKSIVREIREYLSGKRRIFNSKTRLLGTDFQKRVWREAKRIAYGKVASYGDIAKRIGMPHASRAVGNAMGANLIPLIVPCHRVIRSDGSLGGFGAGITLKKKLLALEKAYAYASFTPAARGLFFRIGVLACGFLLLNPS